MRASKGEIDDGKSLLETRGWLSRTVPAFRAAVLTECQWHRVEQHEPIARGEDTLGGMYGVAQGVVGVIPANASPDAGLIHIDRAPSGSAFNPS